MIMSYIRICIYVIHHCLRHLHTYCCCLLAQVYPTLLWPHGLRPTRLLCPWDFPGKNPGVGCISFSRGSSWPRNQTQVSCIAGRFIKQQQVSNTSQSFTEWLKSQFPSSLLKETLLKYPVPHGDTTHNLLRKDPVKTPFYFLLSP